MSKTKNIKLSSLESLKEFTHDYILNDILEALKNKDFYKIAEYASQYSPRQFSSENNKMIASTLYVASKNFLYTNKPNYHESLNFLMLAKKYCVSNSFCNLIKEKIKLVQGMNSCSHITSLQNKLIDICKTIDPTQTPIEVIRTKYPELFNQALSPLKCDFIDKLLAIGVYRWRGDTNSSEIFSQILRNFKLGRETEIEFLSFIATEYLREHFELLKQIDYIIPVPAEPIRENQRGFDLTKEIAKNISDRLALPLVFPLGRKSGSKKSKDSTYDEILEQYYINNNNKIDLDSVNVLLFDDIVTRAFTIKACAKLLKSLKASTICAFCLARAESSNKSSKYL